MVVNINEMRFILHVSSFSRAVSDYSLGTVIVAGVASRGQHCPVICQSDNVS